MVLSVIPFFRPSRSANGEHSSTESCVLYANRGKSSRAAHCPSPHLSSTALRTEIKFDDSLPHASPLPSRKMYRDSVFPGLLLLVTLHFLASKVQSQRSVCSSPQYQQGYQPQPINQSQALKTNLITFELLHHPHSIEKKWPEVLSGLSHILQLFNRLDLLPRK